MPVCRPHANTIWILRRKEEEAEEKTEQRSSKEDLRVGEAGLTLRPECSGQGSKGRDPRHRQDRFR